jgi:hypothetical protein
MLFTESKILARKIVGFHILSCGFGTLPSEISLDSASDKASTSYYTEHGTWSLEETRTRSYNFDAGSMFKVFITIKRRPVFFLVNIIFPVLFLTLLNSFVSCACWLG